MSGYVPLWCKSNFSFLEGASHPAELVEACHFLGLPAMALTDRDGVYGIVQAHLKASGIGVKLVVGSEVTLADGSSLVLLVQNRPGYANLCRLLSKGRLRSPKGQSSVSWQELCEHGQDLIALWGGRRSLLVATPEPLHVSRLLRDAFGDRLYALLTRHHRAEEVGENERLVRRARRYDIPLVAATEVLYATADRRRLHDVLTCIRHGTTLTKAGRLTCSNSEHAIKATQTFSELFPDNHEAVLRSNEVASRCDFSLSKLRYRYPTERLPCGKNSFQQLQQLVLGGARHRYHGDVPQRVASQLEKELRLIDELDYPGYFLTMHEIVQFCHSRNILCQGRGSAANSVVCYCLGITAIDPVAMDLLFERFISRERAEPPDIDLDIEHKRREEVIQHVYEKYGRSHAAMVANVVRYRPRSAVREVGKALGLPETAVDRLARTVSHYGTVHSETMEQAGMDPTLPLHAHLLQLSNEILRFPRHLSVHPGGFLLGHEPVHDIVPIENATMSGRTVIQWNKDDIEALGLFKVDLLGLGALTHLHRTFDLLADHGDVKLDMSSIPPDDPDTYAMMTRGDTIGVFQIESRAQMAMLPRLKPRCFYDLVIEISIVRPGPIAGGMIHPYLRRRDGKEEVSYPHPCLEPVLEKTLGIPLFQEQVMKLAVVGADYTPGEADQLRRDMAAWRTAGCIERHRELLISRMIAKGIRREFAERVFEQIRGFGEYGFPESHAASFALIAYATAWLKYHHPAEFACALLNSQPMGFYSPATIVDDTKRHDVTVLPIDLCKSSWDCSLEEDPQWDQDPASGPSRSDPAHPSPKRFAIRMGLRYLKGVSVEQGREIERARRQGEFTSLEDFVKRCPLDEKTLKTVVEAGALDAFGFDRRQTLWRATGLQLNHSDSLPLCVSEQIPLFPTLTDMEIVSWDYLSSSHSTRGHPLSALRGKLSSLGLPDASTLSTMADGSRAHYAGLVICRQRPYPAGGVVFMTLEDETGFVNLVIWQRVFEQYAALAKSRSFLGVSGRIQSEQGLVHLLVERLWSPQVGFAPQHIRSRDFH